MNDKVKNREPTTVEIATQFTELVGIVKGLQKKVTSLEDTIEKMAREAKKTNNNMEVLNNKILTLDKTFRGLKTEVSTLKGTSYELTTRRKSSN